MLIRQVSAHERLVEILEQVVDRAVVVDAWDRPGGISMLGAGIRIVAIVGDVAAAVTPSLPPRARRVLQQNRRDR